MAVNSSIFYALVCICGWGFSTFTMGYVGKHVSSQTGMIYQLLGCALVNFFSFWKAEYGFTYIHVLALMNGVAFSIADIAYYKLSGDGMDVSTLGPVTALYVVVPIILGITILKEPLTTKKAIGLVLAVIAIYILSSSEHESEPEEHKHVVEEDLLQEDYAHKHEV